MQMQMHDYRKVLVPKVTWEHNREQEGGKAERQKGTKGTKGTSTEISWQVNKQRS